MARQPKWLEQLGRTRDGVFVVNARQRITYWNKGAERILGFSQAEVLNQRCYAVLAGKSCDASWCHANCHTHRQVLQGVLPGDFDLLTRTKAGKKLWVNVSIIAPLKKGKPLSIHLFRDVTQQKRNEHKLETVLSSLGVHRTSKRKSKWSSETGADSHRSQSLAVLTGREIEVLTLLAEGRPTRALARQLGISHFTVRCHLQNALKKLGLHSKAQAVSFAFRNGLL